MLIGHQLAPRGEFGQRFVLPGYLIVRYELDTGGRQHEEAAIDYAAVATGLFGKSCHTVSRPLQRAVSSRRSDRGNRRELAVAEMEVDRATDINVAQTIAIGKAKRLFVPEMVGHA